MTVQTDDRSITGTVVSVRAEGDDEHATTPVPEESGDDELATDGGDANPSDSPTPTATTATAGGPGRVTIAVTRRDVKPVLEADAVRLVVRSRGTSREFEAFALLKREGYAVRRLTVCAGGSDGEPADGAPASTTGVTILAVRRQGSETGGRRHGWVFGPGIERPLAAGDEAFVAGPDDAVDTFVEAIAR